MTISAKTKICMVIGNPVEYSLSPLMHNAAYTASGIDDKFVFVASKVDESQIADFVRGVRVMGIHGVSCTMPHKVVIMPYLDAIDKIAQEIGAVNTVVNENGVLKGFNTDWIGVKEALESITNLRNKTVAIIGAGGAARAIVYAVSVAGGKADVYDRNRDKSGLNSVDIICNATPVGMNASDEMIIPDKLISAGQIVFDVVYKPYETKLLQVAKRKGATVVHGMDMLLHQGTAQFKLFTGIDAPEKVMREVLWKKLT